MGNGYVGPQGPATRVISGSTLPATCTVGQVFVVPTGGSAGMYVCFTTDAWTLLDSNVSGEVTGSGTTNVLPKWSNGAGSVIGDSLLKDDGTTFSVNTNKFTVTEASGNTFFAGVLSGGSGPITITDSTGKILSAALNTVGAAQGGTGVANNAASTIAISGNFATTFTVTGITGVTLPTTGTLATLAGTEELTNKTLNASVGKGTWTASGTWTLPAFTLGGTVSGGAQALNNIGSIGASNPGTGAFTTLNASTSITSGGLTAGRVTYAGTAGLLSDDSGFTYNSGTHALTATTFVGALSGNATTATTATSATNATNGATVAVSNSASYFPLFAASSSNGNQPFNLGTGLTFNPSTNNLATTTFTGALVGNASTASTASAVAVGGITGLGTGVATALAINVGSAGALITFNGNAGTPSALVGTNISGTAASLTAGTASAVAASGITGTTLAANVVASSLTSVGTLTALTVSGQLSLVATGAAALFDMHPTTGTNAAYGTLVNTGGTAYFGLESSSAGNLVTGDSAYAFIIAPSSGKVIQFAKGDKSAVTATFSDTSATFAGALINTGITSDATHTDSAVCQDTTSHQFYAGSGAAGICLGTSSRRFKHSLSDIKEGLAEVLKLRPRNFRYKKGIMDDGVRLQYGLIAEEVNRITPNMVAKGKKGEINSVDYGALFAIYAKAFQDVVERYDPQIELLNTRLNTVLA